MSRSPQGQPVIFQAGDSDQGRDLGATIGEGIFTHAASIAQGQAFCNDLKGRAAAKGRDPDEIVIMPGVTVYVGDTDAEAREIERDLQTRDRDFGRALAELGRPFAWHDFRQYDLDAPFPQEALVFAERGLVRTRYASTTLRGNLGLPVPENRYTKARESALLRL